VNATPWLEPFPDPRTANPWGPLAIGGDLSPERLLLAYTPGIFPWYSEAEPIQWWSPDPRAIFELTGLRVSRRLRRTIRSGRFRVTADLAFERVMRGCAEARPEGTWITGDMLAAYARLHALDLAHSVEVWSGDALVGGVYGVSIRGFFAGESMFHRARDASKVALYWLLERLRARGFALFDTQVLSPHTERLGAIDIRRSAYLARLESALALEASFGPPGTLAEGRLEP